MPFNDLSFDTIDRIVYWASTESELCLRKWKHALRLLSVSPKWRSAGLVRLYRVAFVADIKAYRYYDDLARIATYQASQYTLPTPTNTNLIAHANRLSHVKHVVINGKRDYNGHTVLAHIISIMQITNTDCPSMDELKSCSQSEFADYSVNTEFKRRCFRAIQALSAILHQKYPHARKLTIDTFGFCNTLAIFSAELLHCYFGQVVEYVYKGISYFPHELNTVLTHLDLAIYRFSDEPLPRIPSHMLQSLKLHLGNIPFSWSLFHTSDDGRVAFDRLEHLSITYDTQATAPTSWYWTCALLPRLTSLCVSSCRFTPDDVRWLLDHSPLVRINLIRSLEPAFDLFPHNLSSLQELKMSYIDSADDLHFIDCTNRLFRLSLGIPNVRCELFSCKAIANTLLDWPNLTQLKIHHLEYLAPLLLATPHMPHLLILEARFSKSDVHLDAREPELLSTLNEAQSKLSTSRLEKLSLDFDDAQYTRVFTDRLVALQKYFSRLHSISWI
ncbi:hypothetical protein GGH12_003861 [Coemansia sp. RSA 1822]|nr:hypothetical protein LPJ76_003373 [Coemansia sp. RSA 638]KAJ2541430.1 hypothetical protein GGF49_003675 [Coemansia sp. RSA 1853]KAJ2561608.1 hypothetical protein GGH12_003861 [Coemansia sp. RSA 1822]